MDRITGNVYETMDYDKFHYLEGNRNTDIRIIAKIVESIKQVGQVKVPIIVNERFEIIDGQNRLQAFRRLGLPVYYSIAQNCGIDQCISLNMNQVKWTKVDYVISYANRGNVYYQKFYELIKKYPEFNINVLYGALTSSAYLSTGSGAFYKAEKTTNTMVRKNRIMSGELEFSDQMYESAIFYLDKLTSFNDVIKKLPGNKSFAQSAILFALRQCECDQMKLLNSLEKRYSHISPFTNVKTAIDSIQDAYNYNSKKGIMYLSVQYDKFCRATCINYEARHRKSK